MFSYAKSRIARQSIFFSRVWKRKFFIVVILLLFLLYPDIFFLRAEDYSSSNFILRDPVITVNGGRSTSSNFESFSSIVQPVAGEQTSSNFIGRSGWLYFPQATLPVVTATVGNAKVSLSWTAAIGTFANITTYELGTATVSGGPYMFESVGNALSFTKTGLTNGTTYYFKVQTFAGTLRLAESGQVSVTPTVSSTPPPSGDGGGGGSGFFAALETKVVFFGRAYPGMKVTVLKDAQIAAQTLADPAANFRVTASGLSGGGYIFGIYSEDSQGRRSSLLTFPVTVTSGVTIEIGGIFIAPTIAVDKNEVQRGDNIAIFGQSVPRADVTVAINSEEEFFGKIIADQNGAYLYNFDTAELEAGQHLTKSKAAVAGAISSFSKTVSFSVGAKTVFAQPSKCPAKADLNNDCKVNLVDFSIVAYWYKRSLSTEFKSKEAERLNGDGKVDIIDFSIMAYYWTG